MVLRFMTLLMLCGCGMAQTQSPWPCRDDIRKSDASPQFIRVSDRVTNKLADQKVMPDVSDLKGKDLDSVVVVETIVGPDGNVRCARIQQGETDPGQRSVEAAQQWHYKPYILNGKPVNVDTWIRFSYKKDSVEVVLPDR